MTTKVQQAASEPNEAQASVTALRPTFDARMEAALANLMERERYRALTRLVPVQYVVVSVAAVSLCFSLRDFAPILFVFILPSPLLFVIGWRLRYWVKARHLVDNLDQKALQRRIRIATPVGPFLSLGFTLIGILGTVRADPFHFSLILIAIWITATASAFCMYVLPRAAISILLASAIPIVIAFLFQRIPLLTVFAALLILLSALFIYMIKENCRAFFDILKTNVLIAEQHRAAELAKDAATQMAHADHLTGVSNRRHFETLLADRLRDKVIGENHFVVGIVDLDGFKAINDAYGHAIGDVFLKQTARRLASIMDGRGDFARVGGDEFALIGDGIRSVSDALLLGQLIQSAFATPFAVGELSLSMTCTCGFAIHSAAGGDPTRLIDWADMALHRSKAGERGGIAIFDPSDEALVLEQVTMEQALRKAVAEQQVEVHFQPIVDFTSGRVNGFEALARWNDERLGQISPAVFIPIAERIGVMEALSASLLIKAATAAARWPDDLTLSFNLSATEITKPMTWQRIAETISQCGLPARRFEAELTETAILKDLVNAHDNIDGLRSAGIRIALDDFGTGHSSLSHLKNFPLDHVKIDKSFVDSICIDSRIGTMVTSLIEMCNRLGITCVAEGIEQDDQMNELQLAGCKRGQGYLFSRAMSEDDIGAFLERINANAGHLGISRFPRFETLG